MPEYGSGWKRPSVKGHQVNLTRTGGLAVAAASGLALIAAGLAPAAAAHVTPRGSAAPAVTHYTGTTGVARLVPRSARHATGATRMTLRGVRVLPSHTFSATERVPHAPAAAAPRGAAATATALSNFNGVSSRDSEFTNYNQEFEPPDQGLCEANGFVLEPVNSAYRVYLTNGKSIRGPFNINDLFNVGGKEFTSDPRCWYDPGSQSWFATILFLNDTSTQGTELIAVRHAKDPLGVWNEYSIDATDTGGRGCPCFGDQPRIGIDQQNLYITADQFSIQGPQFDGGELWVINKAGLVAGNPTVKFAHFGGLKVDGQTTLAPQPALSTVKPHAEFMLSSLDFNGQGDNRIGVWAITDRAAVASGGLPTVSSIVVNSEQYANPPPPPQKGSPSKLNPDDDRMQQTEFADNSIWGELTTAVTPAGDTTVRSGGAWFQVKPRLSGGVVTGAKIVRQGYLDAPGQYLIYPAVQPDAAGNAAAVFTESNSTEFPSAAYATLTAGAASFGPPVVVAKGTGPYSQASSRWGDYSFAVPGPSDTAWLATEYIPPKSSQTTDGVSNWGTRVFQVPQG
jgi:hypothetical protein